MPTNSLTTTQSPSPTDGDGAPVIDPELVFNESLSNRFRNDYMNQNIRIGYRKVTKKCKPPDRYCIRAAINKVG